MNEEHKMSTNQLTIYHIDAFTSHLFKGNPAAVCVLKEWLHDDQMVLISKENNLPVTAFILLNEGRFHIRWFTPEYELDLCGHGSLAAAFVIFNYLQLNVNTIILQSKSETLEVTNNNDLITLKFPIKTIESTSISIINEALGVIPEAIYQHQNERCLVVLKMEDQITQLKPNMEMLKQIPHRGVVVTAKGNEVDFVSRTFYPHKTTTEDQVTGASHCLLVPYWAKKLNKTQLHAIQLSARGGELFCQHKENAILLGGRAVLYMKGIIYI
jgi:PhzF family phenazine biosynthesis protein